MLTSPRCSLDAKVDYVFPAGIKQYLSSAVVLLSVGLLVRHLTLLEYTNREERKRLYRLFIWSEEFRNNLDCFIFPVDPWRVLCDVVRQWRRPSV